MVTPRCLFAGADDLTLAKVGFRKRYNIGALIIRIGVWGSFSIAILSTNRLSELSDLLLVCSPSVSPFVLHSAMQHTHTHTKQYRDQPQSRSSFCGALSDSGSALRAFPPQHSIPTTNVCKSCLKPVSDLPLQSEHAVRATLLRVSDFGRMLHPIYTRTKAKKPQGLKYRLQGVEADSARRTLNPKPETLNQLSWVSEPLETQNFHTLKTTIPRRCQD